jgi:hypothetical protein
LQNVETLRLGAIKERKKKLRKFGPLKKRKRRCTGVEICQTKKARSSLTAYLGKRDDGKNIRRVHYQGNRHA